MCNEVLFAFFGNVFYVGSIFKYYKGIPGNYLKGEHTLERKKGQSLLKTLLKQQE